MNGIFTENIPTDKKDIKISSAPIAEYNGYIVPAENDFAKSLGEQCADEITKNIIADFERTSEYCEKNNEQNPDLMVHVSTFKIIDGIVYMTYYANTGSAAENPNLQEARLAFCTLENPQNMTILKVQKVGEELDGKKIDCLYDTILLYKGGKELMLMWTASADGEYYRFYRIFDISTHKMSDIRPNRFKVGDVINDFSVSGMQKALTYNGIGYKTMFSDIGIMQKLSARTENGKTYYYTGTYSGYFNAIIKSCDFITWEYVSSPDFINMSHWENAVYVLKNKCYYFVRQRECMQGFLTCFNLETHEWSVPCLIRDSQSRSDFVYYNNQLYLFHSPEDRNGFGIVRINQDDFSKSEPIVVSTVKSDGVCEGFFYPFAEIYGKYLYISYTVGRKHIRLSKFNAEKYLI